MDDQKWRSINGWAGEEFTLPRGGAFTYRVEGDAIYTDRPRPIRIPRHHFELAEQLMASSAPRPEIRDKVMGSAYVLAILKDPRISGHRNRRES